MSRRLPWRVYGGAVLLLAGLAALIGGGAGVVLDRRDNATIAGLQAGRDMAVPDDADTPRLVARGRYWLAHGNIAAAQIVADDLANRDDAQSRSALLTAIGNARMRSAYLQMTKIPFWKIKPLIALAKSNYRLAVTLDADNWDARYDYAIAASLVRDTEAASPTAGTAMSHERAVWPDIPGAPNGMP